MGFNFRTILRVISLLLIITGGTMVFPFICALYYREENTPQGFAISMVLSLFLGFLGFVLLKNENKSLKMRDCHLLVIIAWLTCSFIGMIPYILSGEVGSAPDAFFESVSGYTTTGASAGHLSDMSQSIILWKAMTNWMGGMGILVFMIAVLPILGVEGQNIARVETPGPDLTKIAPRAKDIAKMLYFIYISMSVVEFALLFESPKMGFFDALINTMGNISTSGLFLHPEGISYYDSLYVELVISVFAILSSVNYVIYISLMKREFTNIKKSTELKVYAAIILAATLLTSISLFVNDTYDTAASCLRHGFFQTCSFASTTGFALGDYANWPSFTTMLFIILMIIGGCASSTSGGIKVSRFVVMIKIIHGNIRSKLHPKSVSAIKVDGIAINRGGMDSITTFLVLYLMTFLAASLIISIDGHSLTETLSSAVSLLGTTGLYISDQGMSANYGGFSSGMKIFMSFLMIAGRLELFSIFMQFSRSFWNPHKTKLS